MKFSHNWLQQYFDKKLPDENAMAGFLNTHSFEVEDIEHKTVNGKEDFILNIDVLPNRAHDCLSHYGMAKEIASLIDYKINPLKNEKVEAEEGELKVEIEDTNLCRRYIAVEMKDIEIKDSPEWLKERLESIGQKSINNIVDATNYVMFSVGQPLHAFDKDKLDGNKILIRNAKAGEKIITLDKKDVELNETNLIIADENSPLAIAGVKGGNKAEVDLNTKNIILESANFHPTTVRKTSRSLNILTDSSKRFENEISPELAEIGMNELVSLIKEIACPTEGLGQVEVVSKNDIYPRRPNIYKVGVSLSEAEKLLGLKMTEVEIKEILQKLNFDFEEINPIERVLELANTLVGVPYQSGASVVYDAPNKFDCSSFSSYLFSQGGVAIPRISVDQYVFGKPIEKSDLKAGDLVFANTGEGKIYYESIEFLPNTKVESGVDHVGLYLGEGKILHSSRYNEKGTEISDLESAKQFKNIVGFRRMAEETESRFVVSVPFERLDLRIKQDLIEEIGRMYGYKNMLLTPVLKITETKTNKTFYYTNKIRKILTDLGFSEVYNYSFRDSGVVELENPLANSKGFMRTNLKDGLLESLGFNLKNAPLLGLDEIKIFEFGKVFPSVDGEYTSFALGVDGKNKKSVIAKRSEAIQKINKELDVDLTIKENESIFETSFDELITELLEPQSYEDILVKSKEEVIKFKSISLYPFMLRDIAVWVPNTEDENSVLNLIKENAGDLLVQTKLFDVYRPEGKDKISYAFNLVFQSNEKTLTDDEINVIMDKIYKMMQSQDWQIR